MEHYLKHITIGGRHGTETEEEVQLPKQVVASSNAIRDCKREQVDQSGWAHENRNTRGGGRRRSHTRSVNENGRSGQERRSPAPFILVDVLRLVEAWVLQSGQAVQLGKTPLVGIERFVEAPTEWNASDLRYVRSGRRRLLTHICGLLARS